MVGWAVPGCEVLSNAARACLAETGKPDPDESCSVSPDSVRRSSPYSRMVSSSTVTSGRSLVACHVAASLSRMGTLGVCHTAGAFGAEQHPAAFASPVGLRPTPG